jgi:hypothetical protein
MGRRSGLCDKYRDQWEASRSLFDLDKPSLFERPQSPGFGVAINAPGFHFSVTKPHSFRVNCSRKTPKSDADNQRLAG